MVEDFIPRDPVDIAANIIATGLEILAAWLFCSAICVWWVLT